MLVAGKDLGLESLGLTGVDKVHRNLSVEKLIEETVINNEGVIGPRGATIVGTGKYTGRSPKDKYIVDEPTSTDNLWWGPVNQKVDEAIFDELYEKVVNYYNTDESKPICLTALPVLIPSTASMFGSWPNELGRPTLFIICLSVPKQVI